ncbi:MAG: adenosylmethionine decarboxylase [Rhodospirillales bacterium]|nr:adenosylmethionine decarboxylase [Rhodospirillales bacterium]MCW9040379.1 adenosylmethionine decarboxylase [Rhodospirillales bacterium]
MIKDHPLIEGYPPMSLNDTLAHVVNEYDLVERETVNTILAAGSSAVATAAFKEPQAEERKDYFVEKDGERFAGTHLIIDLIGAKNLGDMKRMDAAMRECVEVCKATLLHIHLHHFTPNGGISGVAVLSESHISVHTWPERDYAAFDVFMCGGAEPLNAIPVLEKAFGPVKVVVDEIRRGKDAA